RVGVGGRSRDPAVGVGSARSAAEQDAIAKDLITGNADVIRRSGPRKADLRIGNRRSGESGGNRRSRGVRRAGRGHEDQNPVAVASAVVSRRSELQGAAV